MPTSIAQSDNVKRTRKTRKPAPTATKPNDATSAEAILRRRFVRTPEAQKRVAQAREELLIGQQIFAARTKAGLSQGALAKKIGTQASAISRIEDADYDGHSLSVLRRVADALGCRLQISLLPV